MNRLILIIPILIIGLFFVTGCNKRIEETILGVSIIDVELMNTLDEEKNSCLLCKQGYYIDDEGNKHCSNSACSPEQIMCAGGSLKITFRVETNADRISYYYTYNGVRYPFEDYFVGYGGLNIHTYAWKDYNQSEQNYKVCASIDGEKEVCSSEYTFVNPC